MVVRVTKPEFNIRSKLTEIESLSGNHGSEIIKSETVEESFNLVQAGRKNFFINGACQIWQRGTSNPNVNNYGCDRWWKANGATQMDRSTDVPNNSFDGQGLPYSMKVTSNGSGSNIGQAIELTATGRTQFKEGKKYTMSFWAKTDSGTNEIGIVIYYRNSKFTGTNQVNWLPSVSPNVGIMDTTWRRFQYTFVAPPVNANNNVLAIELGFTTTAYFTGLQFEEGSQATPFEYRHYEEDFELCRRYYQQIKPGTAFMQFGVGFTYGNQGDDTAILHVTVPTPMRTTPTFSYVGNLNQYYEPHAATISSITSITLVQNDTENKQFDLQVLGTATTQKLMFIATLNNTDTGFRFDAEL